MGTFQRSCAASRCACASTFGPTRARASPCARSNTSIPPLYRSRREFSLRAASAAARERRGQGAEQGGLHGEERDRVHCGGEGEGGAVSCEDGWAGWGAYPVRPRC